MSKDYYKILEVDRNADEKAIKSAFRRLARKYHPDLNPGDKAAEARFKEINEANEVLSDPEKRKLFDQYGSNWEQAQHMGGDPGAWGGGGGFEDIFSHLFQNFGSTSAPPQRTTVQPRDVTLTLDLTLEDLDKGTKRTVSYQVADACKSCDGRGKVKLRTQRDCPDCRGSGRTAGGLFGGQMACPSCQGTGKTNEDTCPSCRGSATVPTNKKVEVTIPAGITDGKKLRVPGRGGLGTNGRAGDLYIVIHELIHDQFRRVGEDLQTEVEIPFTLAALGGEIQVPTLRGSVKMRIPELTQSGQTFRLSEQGMQRLKGGRSNLMVRVKIMMPKSLTAEQRKLLQSFAATEVHHA